MKYICVSACFYFQSDGELNGHSPAGSSSSSSTDLTSDSDSVTESSCSSDNDAQHNGESTSEQLVSRSQTTPSVLPGDTEGQVWLRETTEQQEERSTMLQPQHPVKETTTQLDDMLFTMDNVLY